MNPYSSKPPKLVNSRKSLQLLQDHEGKRPPVEEDSLSNGVLPNLLLTTIKWSTGGRMSRTIMYTNLDL